MRGEGRGGADTDDETELIGTELRAGWSENTRIICAHQRMSRTGFQKTAFNHNSFSCGRSKARSKVTLIRNQRTL